MSSLFFVRTPSRPARHLSAGHDAWRFTLVIRVHQVPGRKFGGNSLHLQGNIEKEKSKKKSLATE